MAKSPKLAMTPEEFRAAIADLGYSQERIAELVGSSGRTGQKWALGETRIPNAVIILLHLFKTFPKALAAVEGMSPMPTRTRTEKRSTRRAAKKAA
ncbi:MAG: helix-turn-helix domain-containing protein [Hyphomicrobium sp.]